MEDMDGAGDIVGLDVGAFDGDMVGLGVEQHSPRTLQESEGIMSGSSPVA